MRPDAMGLPNGARAMLVMAVPFLLIACDSRKSVPLDRSWSAGTVTVEPTSVRSERGVNVAGEWPGASPGLWIRYQVHLTQSGRDDVFLVGGQQELSAFRTTGVSDYTEVPAFLKRIDRGSPYRAVFDFEIWDGKPSEGRLLQKTSAFSRPIAPKDGA